MSFGAEMAEIYDELHDGEDVHDVVELLAGLAGGGPVLELGIGTGRVALPLAERGLAVTGIDNSEAMVAKLREKPGGDRIPVSIGDFADVSVDGSFRLVFVVFNTLFNLLTQDDQVRCVENVAAHLAEDGSFVVEAFVPLHLMDLREAQYVQGERIETGEVRLDVARHDVVEQLLYESHVALTREGVRLYPVVTRYAWPRELDLMARIAGLSLRERWGGWNREPFSAASRHHVSVYGR
jgi:SAM-dependent methyltransferase